MRSEEETRQLAFRLPQSLIGRLEHCEKQIQNTGVNLSRTELVRLLLSYALDATKCDLAMLVRWEDEPHNGGNSRRGNKTRRNKP